MHGQCGILFLGQGQDDRARIEALRNLGFRVDESAELPAAELLAGYHAVIVRARDAKALTTIGTRLRGRPHFGRRALLALVTDEAGRRECRDARMCGFDDVLADSCGARDIAASVLRLLRGYPEYRCLLRTPRGRRKAA